LREKSRLAHTLKEFYKTLYRAFGAQGWWPGRTRFEVIVGAILTQNTSWTNVEKAVKGLKRERLLTPARMHALSVRELARHIRPAGYFNIKAKRLKAFLNHLFDNYGGNLDRFLTRRTAGLRHELLTINGIGPETADSILLYAADRPVFVVDAYTKRVLVRHGLVYQDATYEDLQELFMENLARSTRVFNEYHALFVRVGKEFCRTKKPLCRACPLNIFLPDFT
jgi:endonuclease-3 related protein